MNHSPKLKKAIKEIDAIIEKHDIGGVVILHDITYGGHGEYKTYLTPSYSCATVHQKEGVRFKTKSRGQARTTSNLFSTIRDMLAYTFSLINPIGETLDKAIGATHNNSKITGNLGDLDN